jgi:hypothetical protein
VQPWFYDLTRLTAISQPLSNAMDFDSNPNSRKFAAEITINWLMNLHRKGFNNAFLELNNDLMPQGALDHVKRVDHDVAVSIQQNLTEWLLAHGQINARGSKRRINDYVLSPDGPPLSAEQRDWIQQLGQRPLRLYEVTEVIPGQQMTLSDLVNHSLKPMVVMERSGTKNVKTGDFLGCRILRADDHFQISGAAYLFNMITGENLLAELEEFSNTMSGSPDFSKEYGEIIIEYWLEQFLLPPQKPTLMDSYSGEPIVMITEHYQVNDEIRLSQALASQADVEGNDKEGWSRLLTCTDGEVRPLAQINIGKKPQKIELFYITERYAKEGRAWFENLAGDAVKFLRRKKTNPADFLKNAPKVLATPSSKKPTTASPSPQLDPATLSKILTQAIHRSYATWADDKIGILDNKTPREMIKTDNGLERVKRLIRSYETGEKRQASMQGRDEISYDFLWQSLGISR